MYGKKNWLSEYHQLLYRIPFWYNCTFSCRTLYCCSNIMLYWCYKLIVLNL